MARPSTLRSCLSARSGVAAESVAQGEYPTEFAVGDGSTAATTLSADRPT